VDEAESQLADPDALKSYLKTLHGQEARDLIYGTVMEEVMNAPSVAHGGSELLDWLRAAWNVRVEEGSPGPTAEA
jgi:hypothetical protein